MTLRDFKRGMQWGAGLVIVGSFVTILLWLGHIAFVHEPPKPAPITEPPADLMGWAGPEAAKAAEFQVFGGAAPDFSLNADPLPDAPKRVFLWEAAKVAVGHHIPTRRQLIGDCVSHGWSNAIEYRLAVRAAALQSEYRPVFAPFIYGTSRVQVGGGRISGDGSVGAWAAQAVLTYGVLESMHPQCPPYSGSIARQWGNRPGPPKWALDAAKERNVRTAAKTKTIVEGLAAIRNGYPIAVCSNQGFQMRAVVRNNKHWGIPQGNWAHCMAFIGADDDDSVYCLNSWGEDAHGPPAGDEPPGGFWVDRNTADRMLRQDDSYAVSDIEGFAPADWVIIRQLNASLEN